MFDISDDKLTKHTPGSPEDRMEFDQPEADQQEDPLDGADGAELHTKLMDLYRMELARQEENRAQQAMDEDYYDHEQWTPEEKAVLEGRGQAPIVYNVIAQSLNWIIGSEKRGRTDYKILPRGEEDAKPAEGKTKYMKYLSDTNRTPFQRSRAFEDCAKVGIGWLEVYVQDEDDGEPIRTRYESWRNMVWDSASTELDGSDMRYQFRSKWVDEDIAKMLAPDRADIIEQSATSSLVAHGSHDQTDADEAMDAAEESMNSIGMHAISFGGRKRVRLIEAWYRTPQDVQRMSGGPFNGQIYDESDPRHAEAVQMGAKVISKGMMVTRVALMTSKGLLYDGQSPFRHNRFKFVPVWGFRRGRDNLPYGIIRGMRHIQDAINKRASKALHILSTNKIIMEEGALPDDWDVQDLAEEAAKPDAILVVRKGYRMDLDADRNLGAEHMQQMSYDIGFVQTASGITDENLGKETNAASGVAIARRQEQGSLSTSKLFDNLRLASQMQGELELSLIEQYVTDEKQFRITNQRGKPEFITVNDGLPENDITRSKADYVISEADWRATMRAAASEQLGDLIGKMQPEVALVILDLFVEGLDIENREEMVKRIRKVNGQRDPDATEPTPEEQEAMQAAAMQQQLQQAQIELQMADQEAKTAKTRAETARIGKQALADSMKAATDAMAAATQVVSMPTIAKVGDALLQQAGWKGAHVAGMGLGPAPVQPPQQAAPQQQQMMQQQPEPVPGQ